MSLFGIPFLIGTLIFGSYALMTVAGKVEVTQRGDRLTVFTGVGTLGWHRSYSVSEFSSVREDVGWNSGSWPNQRGKAITLEGRSRAAFGGMLTDERRYFVLGALRQSILRQSR